MQYRKMGNLDWEVSALGFGAMRLPKRWLLPVVKKKEAIKIMRKGIDLGINYVDTAYPYHLGTSEKIVGEALKDGYREKVHLATKIPTMNVRKEEDFEKYLQKQLKKLDVDCIDVYLFHHLNVNNFEKVKKYNLIDKMEKAQEEGLIKHIGFSFHDTLPVFKEIVDYYDWDIAQIQYNYMDTGIQATTEGLKYAHEKGMAVVIMEPLRGGFLADPPKEAIQVMKKAKTNRTPVDWALQFLWDKPEISVVLSGMSEMGHVLENCESADNSGIHSLKEEDAKIINQLAEIYQKKTLVPCTACQYCMPCPSDVNIPQNFALLNNKNMKEGTFSNRILQWYITRKYKKMAKNKNQLKKNENNGRASLCIDCGQCVPKCPQSIDIPTELDKVKKIMEEGEDIEDIYPKPS